jgi:hypothetical protein
MKGALAARFLTSFGAIVRCIARLLKLLGNVTKQFLGVILKLNHLTNQRAKLFDAGVLQDKGSLGVGSTPCKLGLAAAGAYRVCSSGRYCADLSTLGACKRT